MKPSIITFAVPAVICAIGASFQLGSLVTALGFAAAAGVVALIANDYRILNSRRLAPVRK